MQLSELVLVLQHELTKAYEFIDTAYVRNQNEERSIHVGFDEIEVEIPIAMSSEESDYNPAAHEKEPEERKLLKVPFTGERQGIPTEPRQGKNLLARVVEPAEKADDKVSPETIGRMRIRFKPMLR